MAKVFDFNFNNVKPTNIDPPETAFSKAIINGGLPVPPSIVPNGKIQRYGTKKEDWYVFFPDTENPGGAAGSWKTGGQISWTYRTDLNEAEQSAHSQRIAEATRQQAEERKRLASEAQADVMRIFAEAKEPENYPYLINKGIRAHGIKLYKGDLLIPMRDANGVLHSVQRISASGEKKNWPGGAVSGHFHTIEGHGSVSYLCEGYATGATIHEVTGATVFIAFSAGNLKVVAPLLQGQVIVAADNDHLTDGNPGLTAARATGLPVVYPQGINGTDFNDLAIEKGLDAARKQLTIKPLNKFSERVLTGHDALHSAFLETLKMGWTIDKILPESSMLSVVFGPPSGGKSFATLDMCLSIATGKEWHGRKTKKKPVLYLAAEGQAGMLKRITAWEKYHDRTTEAFSLLPMPCLIDEERQLLALLAMVEGLPFKPEIIILDTLARSMTGDENSTRDMGAVVIAAGKLIEIIGAQVIIIHHTGKDETKGPRGAIALTGATDSMFKVVRTKTPKQYVLICERQKDDEPFDPMIFNFNVVDTGYFSIDGDSITSLVPEYDPDAKSEEIKPSMKLTSTQKTIFNVLKDTIKRSGIPLNDDLICHFSGIVTPDDKMVEISMWRSESLKKTITTGNRTAAYNAFSRAISELSNKKYIIESDGWVCITKE